MMASDIVTARRTQRDRAADEAFVEAHYRSLHRWFLWLTNRSEDAADLTQETFVALWESLERVHDGAPLKPWLYGIARNVWRKRCARRTEDVVDHTDAFADLADPHPTPKETTLNREATRLLEEAVAQLPLDYREALTLRFWEDLDYHDIAQTLSISEELARWRVHQARKLVRKQLIEAGLMEERVVRAGGKLGWWMRVHARPAPSPTVLEQCLAAIRHVPRTAPHAPLAKEVSHMQMTKGVHVGTLDALQAQGHIVVSMDRPVVVFYHDGQVSAVDNRCPHMGFPLHRGNVQHGILTCYWHHARFDVASGCTFDLWADDVASYPVAIRDGEVWLLPRQPRDEVAHWKRRLKEGMEHGINIIMAKAVIALLRHGVDAYSIVRQAALFGTCYRDDWADGLTILTAMANLLPYLHGDEQCLPLWHGIVRVVRNMAGHAPRWERQPLERDDAPLATLNAWLHHWTLVRHRDGAERCVLTAIDNGAAPAAVAALLCTAATDRIHADGGHVVDFINKAFELLDLIGWEHASEVLPALVRQLVSARGGEETSAWRHPIDFVPLLQQVAEELPALLEEGRRAATVTERQDGRAQIDACVAVLLGDNPTDIIDTLKEAMRCGTPPVELSKRLAYAAAMRICRFSTTNEFSDWRAALHTFTYCNAMHQLLKRVTGHGQAPSPDLVRGIFHGALRVYLDRFLNIPPAPLPTHLDDEPTGARELLDKFLDTLNRQAQVNEAGRIVARYLSLHYPVEPLIGALTYAVVREDADFHTYQMVEAAVRQYEEWRGMEHSHHLLIAAARYLAAHSPTQREMLQTAETALRLHRGETLHEA